MTTPPSPVPTGGNPTGGGGSPRRGTARGEGVEQQVGSSAGGPVRAFWRRVGPVPLAVLVGSVLLLVVALVGLTRDPVPAAEDFGEVPVEVAMTSTGTPAEQDGAADEAEDSPADETQDASREQGGEDAADEAEEGSADDADSSPRLAVEPPARRPAGLDGLAAATRAAADRVPVRLEVGSVDLDVPLDQVGVQDDGQMQIPEDADRAGWYRYGPAPGADAGSTVISGHVDDRDGPGAFLALTDVAEGDEVTVEAADGTRTAYRIVSLRTVAKPELAVQEVFRRDGPHVLQLITCTGPWSPDTRRYTDNLVITAEPVADGS